MWNFNISEAPKGGYVTQSVKSRDKDIQKEIYKTVKIIAATHCGKVITTKWLPEIDGEGGRWEMFCKGQEPLAWMEWPTHPSEGK